jgi:hypothetical protein
MRWVGQVARRDGKEIRGLMGENKGKRHGLRPGFGCGD